MNYQLTLAEQKLADTHRHAAAVISRLLTTPELTEDAVSSLKVHEDAFIAFLLTHEAAGVRSSELLNAFFDSHCVAADTHQQAMEALLKHNGWAEQLDSFEKYVGAIGLLNWNEQRLREALEARYEFIDTYSGCHVFDREALEPFLER